MPDAAREWMQVLLRVLLKYRSLVRPGQLAAELVDVSKSIRELQALLRDASADALHRRDARRRSAARAKPSGCSTRLRRLHLATPAVVVQRADDGAGTLRALPRDGRGRAARARAPCGGRAAGALSSERRSSAPPPRGVAALERWAAAGSLER